MTRSSILSQAPIGLAAVSRAGAISDVTGAGSLLGAPLHELEGRSTFEIWADVPVAVDAVRRALDGEEVVVEVESRDRWFELRAVPDRDESGGVRGAVVLSLEQTACKRAEERGRRDLAFLDSLIENLPDMVFVKTAADLRFVRLNRAGEELIGYRRDEVIGKNDYDFFPDEEAAFFTAKDRAVLGSGQVLDIPEEPIHTRYRGTRILHTKKIPIHDATGALLYLLGIAEDVTDRVDTQANLSLLNARLEAANAELEAFSYSVSHDLRTPLRAIDGFSQALLEDYAGVLDAKGTDYLQRVRCAAQSMAHLIDDMLRLSRVTRSDLTWTTVDLSALCRAIAAALILDAPDRTIELVIADGLVARGDEALLRQVLVNLLSNAWKFTSKTRGARIEVGVLHETGAQVFYVRDNGAGFDMALADKLFGPFQRLHTTDEFPGTGVGLAIVRRIVHRHGGRVWAEGKIGHGATFYFTLPGETSGVP